MLADILKNFKDTLALGDPDQLKDAFSHGQINSKAWAIEHLSKHSYNLGTVYVLCNWYGVFPLMLFDSGWFDISRCVGWDIDPACVAVADALNGHIKRNQWKYKSVAADITSLDYMVTHWEVQRQDGTMAPQVTSPSTIINCACEHLSPDWFTRIPQGKLVLLQSTNDTSSKGHINPMSDLKQFHAEYPLDCVYTGTLELENGRKRFMLIGHT